MNHLELRIPPRLLGAAVAAALLAAAFVHYMNRFRILPEERALPAKFGEPCADYLARTRRWP